MASSDYQNSCRTIGGSEEINCMNKRQSLQSMVCRQATPGFFRVQPPEEELILDPVVDSDRVQVADSIDPLARIGYDLGIPPWSMSIEGVTMILKRSDEHEIALHTLLGEMKDPTSPLYPSRFTGEDFAQLFGLTERDIDKVVSWMRLQGLESLKLSPARTSITFSGNLLAVEAAFRTEFHRYRFEGREYLANACELSVPAAFAPVISGFCHLSNLAPKPSRQNTPH
jgi:hypothetical protein